MALYQEPMERLTKILSATATVTTEQLRKYGTFSITGSSAVITLPTPSENNCGLAVVFVNNTAGQVTLSCSSGFVQAASTITIESANSQLVYSMKVTATAYKWITFGIAGTIAGLQETVEDYIDGLMQSGTEIAWTYDDAGGTGEFSIVADSIALSKFANVGTSGDPLVSGGTGANPSYTTLGVSGGGSGAATLLDHGVLVGLGTSAITALTVGTNGQVLVGSTGADPVFATITAGDGLSATTGAGTLEFDVSLKTNGGIVLETDALAIDLAATAMTNYLGVADGGTGLETITDHSVMVGSGVGAVTPITVGTNGQLLVGSTGADPVFASVSAGDGIDITEGAGTFGIAVDVKANSGLVIDTTELSLDLGATTITGTLAVKDGGTGATSLDDHAILVGSGATDPVTCIALTTGQMLIGVTGSDPTTVTPTATPGNDKIPISSATGKLDGWISTATAATPGLIEHLNWGDWACTFTWDVSPSGAKTTVSRYRHVGNSVEFYASVRVADSEGKKITGFNLPVIPGDHDVRVPLFCIAFDDTAGTLNSLTDVVAWADAETPSTTAVVLQATAFTNATACEFAVSGSYEVAAT